VKRFALLMRDRPLAERSAAGWLLRVCLGVAPAVATPALADDPPSASPAADKAEPKDDKTDAVLADDTPVPGPGVAYYEALAKKTPGEAQNHQLLAAAYMRQGRADDARRAAKRAIELAPDVGEMQQMLGLVEEGDDKLPAAEAAFQKAVALDKNVEFRLDLARVLFRQDKRPEAEAVYAAVVAEFGGDADVQLALAGAYKELGRQDDAIAAFDKAIELTTEPAKKADALTEKARLFADKGETRVALDLLTRARELNGTDPDTHYNLGVLYVRSGQYDAGVTAFDAAIKLKPDHGNALNNKGVALEKAKKLDDAVKAFEAALAVDARNGFARYNLGLSLFKLRKFKEAQAAFEKLLEQDPESADAKFFLGEIYYQTGDTKKALRLYKDALRSNPDDATTHRRLGDMYLHNGELDLAVGEYWAAIDADKDDDDIRAQLMRVLLARNKEGDVRRAVQLGDEGLKLNAKSLDVRIALADAESQAGRSPRARQLLDEGTTLTPDDPKAHVALGRFLLEQGKVQDAQDAFRAALAKDARFAPALAGDGDAALTQNDVATAEKRYLAALAVDPSLAEARAELGYILYKANKNDDAIKELTRATDDAPGLGRPWFYLAFAQFKAGQKEAALASLKKAVALQPDLAEAWFQLGKLHLLVGTKEDAKKAFLAAEKARGGRYEEARLELERLQ
jgi:tetratricopeptide (TPR) repeat protein